MSIWLELTGLLENALETHRRTCSASPSYRTPREASRARSRHHTPPPSDETRTKSTASCQLERTPWILSSPSTTPCECEGQPWLSLLRPRARRCLHGSWLRAGAVCAPLSAGVVTGISLSFPVEEGARHRRASAPRPALRRGGIGRRTPRRAPRPGGGRHFVWTAIGRERDPRLHP
jgi:hypothetical protein